MFLDARKIFKSYGGLEALGGVSISVGKDEIVGIIGPNGAGKSTLIDCLTNRTSYRCDSIEFDGNDIKGVPPHELPGNGIVRTHQETRVFETMTVMENMLVATDGHPGERTVDALTESSSYVDHEARIVREAAEKLEVFDLDDMANTYASDLSGGQRKLLALARALMLEPELMFLDEPFAGINPTLQRNIMDRIRSLNEAGRTFVIVEHELESLSELVDRLIVLNNGQNLTEGPPEEVLNDERVIEVYMGE